MQCPADETIARNCGAIWRLPAQSVNNSNGMAAMISTFFALPGLFL
jgi:hypothetical protein